MMLHKSYNGKRCKEKEHQQKQEKKRPSSPPPAKIVFKGKPTLFQCKICNGILTDSAEREAHISECHQSLIKKMGISPVFAVQHLFEILQINDSGEIIRPNHYRCKLCKEMLSMPEQQQCTHFSSKHAGILDRNHISAELAAKIYREPIEMADKEIPHPQDIFAHFHTSPKELKKVHSSKISFVAKLIEGLRGSRAEEEHQCQCCGFKSKEPWEYRIEGYEPIYLCKECHRRIKCGNFVPTRIIYSGFETGRKKH